MSRACSRSARASTPTSAAPTTSGWPARSWACPRSRSSERLPGIVEYADLGPFIDAPLKTYSSGMRARLGFSIATSVEPDILLLDEVLATGDADFREIKGARAGARQAGAGDRPGHP